MPEFYGADMNLCTCCTVLRCRHELMYVLHSFTVQTRTYVRVAQFYVADMNLCTCSTVSVVKLSTENC
jgi:hypothetical protein